jgi:hypothetical protein
MATVYLMSCHNREAVRSPTGFRTIVAGANRPSRFTLASSWALE